MRFSADTTPATRNLAGIVILCLIVGMMLPGCASRGGRTYSDKEVRKEQQVRYGTVIDVTEVMVEDDPTIVGPVLGGVAGGVLGSLFGGGRGRTLMVLGGAAAGALGGAAGEKGLRRYKALQITTTLENGETLVVVQGIDEVFVKGNRVRILTSNDGTARVQHL